MVTKRLEIFGRKVLIGDLVQMPEGTLGNLTTDEINDGEYLEEVKLNCSTVIGSENNERPKYGSEQFYDINVDTITDANTKSFLNRLEQKKARLSYVTADTINDFSLQDVVMVLPGHGVAYPKNSELKQIYLDVLKQDGLENGFEDMKNKDKRFSLIGDYRTMIGKPEDVSYRLIHYSDPNTNLTLSDFDVIKGKEAIKDQEDGNYEALIIEMSLRSSMYATMAIREVTRMDTGKPYQSLLTERHQETSKAFETGQSGTKRDISNVDGAHMENQSKLVKVVE